MEIMAVTVMSMDTDTAKKADMKTENYPNSLNIRQLKLTAICLYFVIAVSFS
jgi:hypothetical protein